MRSVELTGLLELPVLEAAEFSRRSRMAMSEVEIDMRWGILDLRSTRAEVENAVRYILSEASVVAS